MTNKYIVTLFYIIDFGFFLSSQNHLLFLFQLTGNFDLLVYTHKDVESPDTWDETGPQFIANSDQVRLRSFTTTIHKVDTCVSYKKTG